MKLSLCHQSQMVLRAKKIRQSRVDNASGDVAACRDQRRILSGSVIIVYRLMLKLKLNEIYPGGVDTIVLKT